MRGIIRIILLLAIVGIFITMIQAGNSSTYVGGAAVILLLIWIFRKLGGKKNARKRSGGRTGTRNVRYNDQPSAPALPSYSEIMQIINDYVGYYATGFDCNITPNHIYITVNFAPGTSIPLAQQRANDLCNEICNTYGISVSVNR